MKLNLIIFVSQLSKQETVLEDHKDILDRLNAEYDIHYVNPEDLDKPLEEGATMVFIGSGGVEELVSTVIDKLPKYVLLIADGLKNSFAASLEILSWMRLNNRNGRVIHGDLNYRCVLSPIMCWHTMPCRGFKDRGSVLSANRQVGL